jgi:hypothetical protein
LNDWLSVFDESFLEDTSSVTGLAGRLCKSMKCPGLGIMAVQSDYLFYWVFNERGILETQSFPTDLKAKSYEEYHGLAGDVSKLAVLGKVRVEETRKVLEARNVAIDDNIAQLGNLLGISNVLWSYKEIRDQWSEIENGDYELVGWQSFVHYAPSD